MLNTYLNHGSAMGAIINELRNGRVIEAIKQHRILYGVGLKEAKDAVEAIRTALGLNGVAYTPAQYVVFARFNGEDEYVRYTADDKTDAADYASRIVNDREDVIVAQVVAKAVTTRSMQNV